MDTSRFEGIRPYFDEEIPSAMARIADSEYFPLLASYVFPTRSTDEVREHIRGIQTTAQFQHEVMSVVNEEVIRRSMTRFTFGGLERLDPAQRYLFVSNHRDIMLDSSLLQYLLHANGHETSEITFGANLMRPQLVVDIGRSNKMFRVERGGNLKEFYRSSLLNSEYIRYAITHKRQSVWIAQRNGRTKDGIDYTEPGLMRMFASSHPSDRVQALSELNIAPIAISYEWETCDIAKALELHQSRHSQYIKREGEDLESILSGIISPKGHVHIELCELIRRDELEALASLSQADYFKAVAALLDERINSSYLLHPTNYVASDIRSGSGRYADRYSEETKQAFLSRLDELPKYKGYDPSLLRDIFLGIYANPVDSQQDASTSK